MSKVVAYKRKLSKYDKRTLKIFDMGSFDQLYNLMINLLNNLRTDIIILFYKNISKYRLKEFIKFCNNYLNGYSNLFNVIVKHNYLRQA